ncbi:AraC family transcriptional regulator [Thermoactinospora rubra]|uniref:AraC family transcriptional regulator n=1 Tax=Thermoactinospora rubra TaxID=1088767 RepID=UPI001F0AC03A|nr:AraC family transcriptional regulator [Thermoactinospora rubra]
MTTPDWSRYWRSPDRPLEAMHAHFEEHVYHRHSHETYSFGVTDDGAQAFRCRGGRHTSAAGMVMAFNPDDPHDGHAATDLGFTYRIVHIGPELVSDVLEGAGLPLFAEPVVRDPVLAGALRRLHRALIGGAPALRREELLHDTVAVLVRRAATSGRPRPPLPRGAAVIAERVRRRLHDGFLDDVTAEDLARAAGASRFAAYRAFQAVYGMPPSDYHRQLRLREARRRIARGEPIGEVAAVTGFADQSHLTRWFGRYFGITPGAYREAASDRYPTRLADLPG